jgi:hypothetical protein
MSLRGLNKTGSTKPIGEVISDFVKNAKARIQPIHKIQDAWPKVVGQKLCAHTRPATLVRGRLKVISDDPGSSFILDIEKHKILQRLASMEKDSRAHVKEIVIRAGEIG